MATFPWGWAFSFLGFVGLMSAVLAPFLGCTTVWHWSASTSTFLIWYPLWVFADIVWCWQGCVSWWDDLVRAGHSKSSLMVHSFKTWIKLAKSLVRCAIFPSLQLQLVCTFHLLLLLELLLVFLWCDSWMNWTCDWYWKAMLSSPHLSIDYFFSLLDWDSC